MGWLGQDTGIAAECGVPETFNHTENNNRANNINSQSHSSLFNST